MDKYEYLNRLMESQSICNLNRVIAEERESFLNQKRLGYSDIKLSELPPFRVIHHE